MIRSFLKCAFSGPILERNGCKLKRTEDEHRTCRLCTAFYEGWLLYVDSLLDCCVHSRKITPLSHIYSKHSYFNVKKDFFLHVIQHCFICRLSDFTVPEDAGIEPKTASAVRSSNRCVD
jgi:hypothetical protein